MNYVITLYFARGLFHVRYHAHDIRHLKIFNVGWDETFLFVKGKKHTCIHDYGDMYDTSEKHA